MESSTIRYLINEDGSPFDSSELEKLANLLDSFQDDERIDYRNKNSSLISQHPAPKILIVSGPGTGKSFLFLQRIKNWLKNDSNAKIFVTSFVRKLVADLQTDIDEDKNLSSEYRNNITVSTLHKFARSIIEQNHGTKEFPLKPHFQIIGEFWSEIVWKDALDFHPDLNNNEFLLKKLENQLHNNSFEATDEWNNLRKTFFQLCKFYNALGFAELIVKARQALEESPNLTQDAYFIIDEYQDFNLAEEALLDVLTNNPKGLLIVGDDEQVLYEKLKAGKSDLIRNLYNNTECLNCMLPYCGRSQFHITKAAGQFIQQYRDTETIQKIYLPLNNNEQEIKLKAVACANSGSAVDYISKFVSKMKSEIDERHNQLETGHAKDAFLLILSPSKELNFYGQNKEELDRIIAPYKPEKRSLSDDYYKVLNYYSLANKPLNNFTFRKILYYEALDDEEVHKLIESAIEADQNLCNLEFEIVHTILAKCKTIKSIIDSEKSTIDIINDLEQHIYISNKEKLIDNLELESINQKRLEHDDEEAAELEDKEIKKMAAIELMTMVGSKGLSADHVIVVGFDNMNMRWVTTNAFYVAITRARKSLHLITALKSGGSREANRFLHKIPDEHIDYFSYKKTGRTLTKLKSKDNFMQYLERLAYMSYRTRKK